MLRKKIYLCLFMLIFITSCTGCSGVDKKDKKEQTDKQTLQSYIDEGKISDGNFWVAYYENNSYELTYDVIYQSVLNTIEVDVTNLSVNYDELEDLKYYKCDMNSDDDIVSAIRLDLLKRGVASY